MKESEREIKLRIESALRGFVDKGLCDAAIGLLDVLGYKSDRFIPFSPNTPENFVATFDAEKCCWRSISTKISSSMNLQ